VTLLAKIKRFLANDKRTYERLQAQKRHRREVREDELDERLQEGHPSAEAVKQSLWIP
jgi:hypothetical protein